ncbi:MAG: Ig-like domain-containing protein, partial [Clostridia bacterium]|nr:Ig-like domain-containing protein [Clostridia bacterium]
MKTGKKNLWLIASLCVAFVISMFFGVYSLNGKKAHATVADNTFEMAGAAVRMDGSQGLRFGAIVADNLVENVEANDNLSFGAFIAPLDWMEYLGITTTYSDSYDYYTNFKTAYAEVSSNTVQHNFHITPYKDNEDGSHELCLTLGGVQYNNMSRTFFGLFCIVNNNGTPSDESDDTFTYARFGDNNKRSYSYVASAALTDTTKNYTSAQKTNLYNVLQLAFYSKNGINQATAESNVAAGTYLEYELELNTSAVTLSVGNTYDIKSSLILNEERVSAKDVLLTYSSSNTDVATVSNSGRITAVGNGTATITVTYANSNGGNYSDSETVSVTVEDSVSYVAITGEYHNNFSVDIAQDNYSVSGTTNNNWANQQDNGFVVQLNGGNNQTKVSFTITNNATTDSNNTLNAKVSIAVGASNMYNDEVELSSTTNGTIGAGRNNATNKGAIINSIAKGEHLNVTITLSSAFSGTNICLKVCPQYSNTTYDPNNTVTISNIYFGSGSAAPSGNAVNIDSADNGSVTANVANAATGDKVYLTVTPSTGYQLASLSVIDESENEVTVQSNVFTMPSSDVTVSATFSKVTYSITNKVSDKVTVASSAQYGDEVNISVADSDYYIVSVTYRANRTLTTIYTDSFEMPNSGVIITAAVVSNDYDINLTNAKAYNANEEEITTAKPGEEITIVANTPATGYEFDEWTSDVTLDGETSTTTFTMTASDVTISASYKLATYTITIDNSITDVWAEVGGVEVTEATYGSTVVLNTDRANSSVASYNGNSGNTFTLTGNITITAVTYDISYTITVTGGTASTSLAAAGTKITITAGAAATGKEFSGWTISPSVTYTDDTSASSSTAYFTMPAADVTITANYTDRIY